MYRWNRPPPFPLIPCMSHIAFPGRARTFHLCIDMQGMFHEQTDWHMPWMEKIIESVREITAARPEQTIFTRFIPPRRPEERRGAWRTYYEKWRNMTRAELDPKLLDIIAPLKQFIPPARSFDKFVYSPFSQPALTHFLTQKNTEALIITGAETDVCVLATVLQAVDLGYRVLIPVDAICSGRDETHDALLKLYNERFSAQIETMKTEELMRFWASET